MHEILGSGFKVASLHHSCGFSGGHDLVGMWLPGYLWAWKWFEFPRHTSETRVGGFLPAMVGRPQSECSR